MNQFNETKQYCVTVKVWAWAFHDEHAHRIAEDLVKNNPDVAGFEIVEIKEDQEA